MTVLFVLFTFVVFLAIDAWVRRGEGATEAAVAHDIEPAYVPEPVWVAGYQMPNAMSYHRGHTWVRPIGNDTVLVGIDDFARQLVGSATKVRFPDVGEWLRQGAKAARLAVGDRAVELVAPVEGEVIEVNPLVDRQPDLATSDPYARGWLFKMRVPELQRNLANLMSGSLVRRFMEDTRERLQHQLMALSGSVLAVGGEPVADFTRHLNDEDWRHLVREFLLT
jgi:glycine cleavage system H protein